MTAAKILEIKVQASKLQETLGMLAETQSQLNAINKALEEATEETKKSGSTLSKAFDSVCKKMKDFALTIKKGVLGGLKDSLKVARNLVMALGAAAASAIAISSGAIQRDREAKDSKVSASQLLAYNYAKEQTGMADGEFNLANLQAKLHDVSASGDFATLGVRREDLRGLNGIDAMNKVVESLRKKGGATMSDGEWQAYASAAESILGISGERRHLLSDKSQKEFNEHYQWGIANGIDNETLKKGEQAWNKFMFVMKRIGMELAADVMPAIIKGLNVFSDALKTIRQYLKSENGQNMIKGLSTLLEGLASFISTVSKLSLEGIGNYLLPALNGVVGVIVDLANGDWKSALSKEADFTKSVGNAAKDLAQGAFNKATAKIDPFGFSDDILKIENLKHNPTEQRKAIAAITHAHRAINKIDIKIIMNQDGTVQSIQRKEGGY